MPQIPEKIKPKNPSTAQKSDNQTAPPATKKPEKKPAPKVPPLDLLKTDNNKKEDEKMPAAAAASKVYIGDYEHEFKWEERNKFRNQTKIVKKAN